MGRQADFFSKFTDATPRNLRLPYGLAFLGSNGLAVSDQAQNCVLYFPFTNGTFTGADNGKAAARCSGRTILRASVRATAIPLFNSPHHVGSDTDGRPYVVDTGNGRVVILTRSARRLLPARMPTLILPWHQQPHRYQRESHPGRFGWRNIEQSDPALPQVRYPDFRPNPLAARCPRSARFRSCRINIGDLLVADVSNRVTFYFPGMAATNGANFIAGRFLAPGALPR